MGDPVTAAIMGGTAALGAVSAVQERRAQKRENREQAKLDAMENNRRIRQAQKEARTARAMTEAQGSMAGQLSSSSTISVLGDIQNQLSSNLEYMDNAADLNKRIMNARQKQADWRFYGQMAKTIGGAAKSFAGPPSLTPTTTTATPAITAPAAPTFQTTAAAPYAGTSSTSIYSR